MALPIYSLESKSSVKRNRIAGAFSNGAFIRLEPRPSPFDSLSLPQAFQGNTQRG
jgi:hypothetical protein